MNNIELDIGDDFVETAVGKIDLLLSNEQFFNVLSNHKVVMDLKTNLSSVTKQECEKIKNVELEKMREGYTQEIKELKESRDRAITKLTAMAKQAEEYVKERETFMDEIAMHRGQIQMMKEHTAMKCQASTRLTGIDMGPDHVHAFVCVPCQSLEVVENYLARTMHGLVSVPTLLARSPEAMMGKFTPSTLTLPFERLVDGGAFEINTEGMIVPNKAKLSKIVTGLNKEISEAKTAEKKSEKKEEKPSNDEKVEKQQEVPVPKQLVERSTCATIIPKVQVDSSIEKQKEATITASEPKKIEEVKEKKVEVVLKVEAEKPKETKKSWSEMNEEVTAVENKVRKDILTNLRSQKSQIDLDDDVIVSVKPVLPPKGITKTTSDSQLVTPIVEEISVPYLKFSRVSYGEKKPFLCSTGQCGFLSVKPNQLKNVKLVMSELDPKMMSSPQKRPVTEKSELAAFMYEGEPDEIKIRAVHHGSMTTIYPKVNIVHRHDGIFEFVLSRGKLLATFGQFFEVEQCRHAVPLADRFCIVPWWFLITAQQDSELEYDVSLSNIFLAKCDDVLGKVPRGAIPYRFLRDTAVSKVGKDKVPQKRRREEEAPQKAQQDSTPTVNQQVESAILASPKKIPVAFKSKLSVKGLDIVGDENVKVALQLTKCCSEVFVPKPFDAMSRESVIGAIKMGGTISADSEDIIGGILCLMSEGAVNGVQVKHLLSLVD